MAEGQELARVIDLHPPRSCFDCEHHEDREDDPDNYLSSWCSLWGQPIDSETYEAEDCSTYEPRTGERK